MFLLRRRSPDRYCSLYQCIELDESGAAPLYDNGVENQSILAFAGIVMFIFNLDTDVAPNPNTAAPNFDGG